jgi:hypothetical protein
MKSLLGNYMTQSDYVLDGEYQLASNLDFNQENPNRPPWPTIVPTTRSLGKLNPFYYAFVGFSNDALLVIIRLGLFREV